MSKGKWTALILLLAVLALGAPKAGLAQAQGSGGTDNAPTADNAPPVKVKKAPGPPELADAYTAQFGLGCVGAAGVALAGTFAAGPSEAVLLLGGGLLTPSNTLLLTLALLGQIGASSCAIGVVAAPAVLWTYGASDQIAAKLGRIASDTGHQVIQASNAAGSVVLTTLGFDRGQTRQVAEGGSVSAQ